MNSLYNRILERGQFTTNAIVAIALLAADHFWQWELEPGAIEVIWLSTVLLVGAAQTAIRKLFSPGEEE